MRGEWNSPSCAMGTHTLYVDLRDGPAMRFIERMEKWLTPGVRALLAAALLAGATVLAPATVRGLCGPLVMVGEQVPGDVPPVVVKP